MIKEFEEDPEIKNLINLVVERGIGIPQPGYEKMDSYLNFVEMQKIRAEGFKWFLNVLSSYPISYNTII